MDTVWNLFSYGFIEWRLTPLDFQLNKKESCENRFFAKGRSIFTETTEKCMRGRGFFSSFGASVSTEKRRKRMYKSFSMELAGRTLTVDIGRVCAQANGAALLKYGETTVLSTATASDKPRDGVDFFPLSVEYEEKMYAVRKDPGRI